MSKIITFLPINGFFTKQKLWLEGQLVLINPKYVEYSKNESAVSNSFKLYKLYSPKHIKNRTLQIRYENTIRWDVKLDQWGYFRCTFDIERDFDPSKLTYFLKESKLEVFLPNYSKGNIYQILDEGKLVVSDIDDTILISHAYNWFRKLATLLGKGALQRKQVEAMNILYQHLNKKYGFIYLSNSEMNLYPLIKNFLKNYKFPAGPLFLREHKRWPHFLTGRSKYFSKQEHKLSTLKLLLETFPDKKVVLVGDSGQRDPETYAMVAKIFPSQIERIFIREIRPGHRSKKLALIHAELERLGVHFEVFHSGNNLLTY